VLGPVIEAYPNSGLDTSLLPTLQCLATLLLLFWLLSGEGGLLRRGLESWPAVQLGLLSYSLYIWQQPFTQWKGLAWLAFPANIFLPLAVSIVSYQLVEVPMRRSIRGWFSQPSPGH
jgi:peptidoglycan/LPS O-acetylase OafA/YrhL